MSFRYESVISQLLAQNSKFIGDSVELDFKLPDVAVKAEKTLSETCPVLAPQKYYDVRIHGVRKCPQVVEIVFFIRYDDGRGNYPIVPAQYGVTLRMVPKEKARTAVHQVSLIDGEFSGCMYFRESLHAPEANHTFSKTYVPLFLQCVGLDPITKEILFVSHMSDGFIMRYTRHSGMGPGAVRIPSPTKTALDFRHTAASHILDGDYHFASAGGRLGGPVHDDAATLATHSPRLPIFFKKESSTGIDVAHTLCSMASGDSPFMECVDIEETTSI